MCLLSLRLKPICIFIVSFFYLNVHGSPTINNDVDTSKEPTRYNFCELEKEIKNNSLPLKHAIRGLNITVGLSNYYVNETNKTKVLLDERNKLPVTLMNAISERAGFYWQDNIYLMSNPKKGETWDEVLTRDAKNVDVAGDWYLHIVDRLAKSLHVSEDWYDGSLIMIMGENNEKAKSRVQNHAGWLRKPFSASVWILIFITIGVTSLVFHFIDFFESVTKDKPMDHSLSDNLFFGLMISTGHFQYQPKKTGTRMLSFSSSALFIIIYSLYTANLANYLVEDMTVVVTVKDLNDAINRGMGICYDNKAAIGVDYIRNNYPSANLTVTDNMQECYTAASDGSCDICITYKSSWDIYKDDSAYNINCNLLWAGKPIQYYKAGFLLEKSTELCNRVIEDVITIYIKEMKEDGYYDTLWSTYLEQLKSRCQNNPAVSITAEGYTFQLQDVIGVFLFHICSIIVAVAIGVFQYCRRPKEERKAIQNELYTGLSRGKGLTARASKFVRTRQTGNSSNVLEAVSEEDSSVELQPYSEHEVLDDVNSRDLPLSPPQSKDEEEGKELIGSKSIDSDILSPELYNLRDVCNRITHIVDGIEATNLRRRKPKVTFQM